jgi:hypothetical protein
MDPRRTKHCRGWGSEPDFLHDARGQLTLFLIIVLIQVWPNEPSLRKPRKHRELLVQRSDSEAAKRPRQPLRKLLAAEAEGWASARCTPLCHPAS